MGKLKEIFFSTLICSVSANVFAVSDITGDYKCAVYDPKKNSHYNEKMTIAKTDKTYRLQYYLNDSPTAYILGTAVLTDNALAAISWNASPPNWMGATLFVVKPDGSLDGTWVTIYADLIGTETCSKI